MVVSRSSIFYQLRNYEENKSWLQEVPHIRYLDMVILFFFYLEEEPEQILLVTNERMKKMQMTVEELEDLASKNTPREQPLVFVTLEKLIEELCEECFQEKIELEQHLPMYVLSNQQRILGASTILYPGALKQISEWIQDDLYILPSSVHECIILPYHSDCTSEELTEMVQEVNETQVPEEDFLSNSIYIYRRESDSICLSKNVS